jgi:protein-disulfide isomerase
VFGGEPIYENQLPPAEQAQLQNMLQQVYGVRRRALQSVLDRRLLEAEAKKKTISVEALLKSEVDSKVAVPTESEISTYYQDNQGQFSQPLAEAKDKIAQTMKDRAIQRARTAYVHGLMEKAVDDGSLVILLETPSLAGITADPSRVKGDPKAPVTIVEFSDFSCLFCRKAESTLNELLLKYQGKIRVGYRDFPLRQIHPHAQLAAEASRCASEQGKFWEYHDLLFANPEKQGHDDLIGHAGTLKLDDKQFEVCLNSGRYKPQVDQDIQLGIRSGIVATPGFFVNGTFLSGNQPVTVFEKIIEEKLAEPSRKPRTR